VSGEKGGGAPKICWDPNNKELGVKILDRLIEENENDIRDTKHKEVVELKSLRERLPGEEVSVEGAGPGDLISREEDDVDPRGASGLHPVE
jgi:hypothetical protein